MRKDVSTAGLVALVVVCFLVTTSLAKNTRTDATTSPTHRAPTQISIQQAAEYERLGPGRTGIPDSGAVNRTFTSESFFSRTPLPATGLFNGIFVGKTAWDAQAIGTTHRQVQTGIDPGTGKRYVHFTWTVLKTEDLLDSDRMTNYACYDWTAAEWRLQIDDFGGIPIIEQGERGGYSSIEVNSSGNAIVFHQSDVDGLAEYARVARFGIPGIGIYVADRLTNLPDQENVMLRGAVGHYQTEPNEEIYHVGGRNSQPGPGDPAVMAYWRFAYQDTSGKFAWEGPVPMDSSMTVSHIVLADGNRVVFAFGKPRSYGIDRNQYNNDMVYYESTEAGADWITNGGPTPWETGGGFNCTDYRDLDPHRFYIDIAGGMDSEGRLHLLYTNPTYNDEAGTISIGPCELLHWHEFIPGGNTPTVISPGPDAGFDRANFHTVARALYGINDGQNLMIDHSPGRWNRYISKPTLAFGDGQTICQGESNLDYVYAVYTQFGSVDPLDQEDVSANGYQNANLWLSTSTDHGFSWAVQQCITTVDGTVGGTPTRSPDCDVTAGDTCLSEHWASVAEVVNDTLHVFYLGDLDAGSVVYDEGNWSVNDVLYLPIFGGTDGDLCPPIHPVPVPIITYDPNCMYHADDDELINTETMTIQNLGNAALIYSVDINYVVGDGWMNFGPYGQSIPTTQIPVGGVNHQFEVNMDGTDLANGLYHVDIQIHHDGPNAPNPLIVPIDFYRADTFVCSETVTMTTPCVVLDIDNAERWGLAGYEGMRYYNEPDGDSLFNPFFDGSMAIANKTRTAIGPDTVVYCSIYDNRWPSAPGFRALEHPKLSFDAASNDSVISINQVTFDSTIGVSVQYLFPQEAENCEFVRIKFSLYPMDDQTHDLAVGAVADIDCPGHDADGLGSENFGGCVENFNLVYLQGTDTTRNGGFTRVTNRFVAGMTALTCSYVKRLWVGDNPLHVYPNGGFEDGYLFTQMDMNGCDIWADSAEDLHSIMSIEEITLGPGDVETYQIALVSSVAGGAGITLADMPADISDLIATTAQAWKKGFGWHYISVEPGGEIHNDGIIAFAATGTHEDGIDGGCCGCSFSFEIEPQPAEGAITLHVNEKPCAGRLEFDNIPLGTYTLALRVEDLCEEQADERVFDVDVIQGCYCGFGPLAFFGDLTCNEALEPTDVVCIVNYVYRNVDYRCWPEGWNCPYPLGDLDLDGNVNPADVVYYVNCIYKDYCPSIHIDPCD